MAYVLCVNILANDLPDHRDAVAPSVVLAGLHGALAHPIRTREIQKYKVQKKTFHSVLIRLFLIVLTRC